MYNGVCAMIEAELAMTKLDDLLSHEMLFNYLLNCGVFNNKQNGLKLSVILGEFHTFTGSRMPMQFLAYYTPNVRMISSV